MESLSGNQVKDLKELYASIYKSDDQEISETTANLQNLDKKNLEAMKVTNTKDKIKKEEEKAIIINLPNGGTTKIYPGSPNYEKAKNKENFSIDSSGERGKINVSPNNDGKLQGKVEIKTGSGDSVEKIEKDTKDAIEKDTNPSGKVIPKPTKPLMKNSPAAKAGIPIETRQKFANQNAAFQATKNKDSGYNKMDFIKDFPGSQTAKKFNKGQPIPGFSYKKNLKNSYEPYDLVLDYVLSEGHADTVEEAHYVMTQMDAETIQTIIEKVGIFKSDVLNKKYPNQPEMTAKGKEILPKLNDPIINGKNYNKIFGISAGSQKALDFLNK